IDWDYRAGHVVGEVRSEELDDLGAIFHRPEPAQSDLLRPVPIAVDAARDNGLHNPPSGAGSDAVGVDAVRPQPLSQIACIVRDRSLRSPVMGVAAVGRGR